MIRARLVSLAGLSLALVVAAAPLEAQVRPDLTWRTLHTTHFRVHYNPENEALARRTAANAEYAYERLAWELVPPRGVIELVLADNVDYANGSATPYPTNRIIVYARPPVEAMSLRNHVDWNLVLVTHELAHIFHLDRARGWWGIAQRVFGRAAPLFPNTYAPSWMVEGLAVHFETAITRGGRMAGTEFSAFARAAALGGHLPALHELSLSQPRFPGGNVSYIFGSFAMAVGAGEGEMRRFVEASSARPWPWEFHRSAKKAFGESFTEYWTRWRDSVSASVASSVASSREEPGQATRALTSHGFEARFPRYLDDTTLIYVANDARQTTGLYKLHDGPRPRRERLGRRNTIDVNSPLDARRTGQTVHAELDYTDPYSLRNDLYRGGSGLFGRRRLTYGERLSSPDVHRASGSVVAVQSVAGHTNLITMVSTESGPMLLVAGNAELTWSEPRWSHAGTRVVATRWRRGGRTSVVVLDSRGQVQQEFTPRGPRLSIVSSPVWVPGDTNILFVSDHEGRAMIYRGDVRSGAIARIWETLTALNTPDVSPDGRRIAAVELGPKGYTVVTRAMPDAMFGAVATTPSADTLALSDSARAFQRSIDALLLPADSASVDSRYSAFDQLKPRWWLPSVSENDAGELRYGMLTGARDVLGRHAYQAAIDVEPEFREISFDAAYSWAGLGNPVLTGYASQEWQHGLIQDQTGEVFGLLALQTNNVGLSAMLRRSRVRSSSYVALGGEIEQNGFRSYPDTAIDLIDNPAFQEKITTKLLEGEIGFSTMQRPGLSVSVEDGVAGSLTHRYRFDAGLSFEDVQETIATMSLAKSIPLPGFARHVVAVRAAYGETGHRSTSAFSVGGVSGTSLELLPGVTVGGRRRNFFVRGFEGGAQLGVRAAAASVEYRAPLVVGGRGLPFLPVFFQKSTLTAFADAGNGWCSFHVPNSFICGGPQGERTWLGSVGGEIALDGTLQYDVLYRFRFGVAHVVEGDIYATRPTTFYFSLGSTF